MCQQKLKARDHESVKYKVVVTCVAWNENGDDRLLVAKRLTGNHCHQRGSDRHAFPSQILDGLLADLGINCHDPTHYFTSFVL